MPSPFLIVIAGPTASGKTSLAISLAKHLDTEILSADSRQFYRGMSIGTSKPSKEELASVRHHFIDSLEPEEQYDISRFESDALKCLDQVFSKRQTAILCGGSGLYINAVCRGLDPLPPADQDIRKALEEQLASQGIEALRQRLAELDPDYHAEVDLSNPHRLIRAIEVCLLTGSSYSGLRKGNITKRPFRILMAGLKEDRETLYMKINRRVDDMIKKGLVDEARSLYPRRHLNALNTVGYSELFRYFDGELSLDEAIELVKKTHAIMQDGRSPGLTGKRKSGGFTREMRRPFSDLSTKQRERSQLTVDS